MSWLCTVCCMDCVGWTEWCGHWICTTFMPAWPVRMSSNGLHFAICHVQRQQDWPRVCVAEAKAEKRSKILLFWSIVSVMNVTTSYTDTVAQKILVICWHNQAYVTVTSVIYLAEICCCRRPTFFSLHCVMSARRRVSCVWHLTDENCERTLPPSRQYSAVSRPVNEDDRNWLYSRLQSSASLCGNHPARCDMSIITSSVYF